MATHFFSLLPFLKKILTKTLIDKFDSQIIYEFCQKNCVNTPLLIISLLHKTFKNYENHT